MKMINLTTSELVMLVREVAYSQLVRAAEPDMLFHVSISSPDKIDIRPVKK